ncbi:hypothetical protein NPIL_671851 [Nephila pilipes]|uniref:Uncharacterized protein n=1 Tax=Nephila pilipes TaxID=299642 RepID=A0A8X6TMQ0_NEPPI|nr:hypothetical protein NPIL_671851 [Nephila pilipes]
MSSPLFTTMIVDTNQMEFTFDAMNRRGNWPFCFTETLLDDAEETVWLSLKLWFGLAKVMVVLVSERRIGSYEINYLTRNRKSSLGQTRGFVQAKQKMPICAKLADHPRYYRKASTSEVRPFIPTDSEQKKGDDSEKGDNEEVQSNNESNRDRESEEDKDRLERFIDLDVEMLNDIALWPTTLTDSMIDYVIRKKPNNIGNIETLKSVYKDRDQVYYRGLSYDHF